MHVTSNPVSRPPAGSFAAAVIAMFASIVGVAQAAEFDEKLKAPQLRDATELRAQAQSYSERDAQARVAGLGSLMRDRQLAKQRFDLSWDLQRAIDARRPVGDLSAQGLVDRGDGSYDVDLTAHPQWADPASDLSTLLPVFDPVGLGIELTRRGMTPEDLATLREYPKSHDVNAAKASALLPIATSFSRAVRKYDKLKRPVPDAMVMSYLYQREWVRTEVEREWAASFLDALGPHASRILQSYLGELQRSGTYAPSDPRAGIDGVLASLRLPDFERRAAAEAKGVTP